jgi:hypothetical protein
MFGFLARTHAKIELQESRDFDIMSERVAEGKKLPR